MQLQTLTYRAGPGWVPPLPTALDSTRTLVLAFGAREFSEDPRALQELAAAFPQAILLGCSTSGEIAGARVNDASITCAVTRFEHTQLRQATTEVPDLSDSAPAGQRLAEQLRASDLRAVLVFADGMCVNGPALVEALSRNLPEGVSITGGLAGDGSRFVRTWVLDGSEPRQRCASAVGFYGHRLQVGSGCNSGWFDFGPERSITHSNGNVLYALDGKPALDLYKNYLGKFASELPGAGLRFPLSIRRRQDGAKASLVRPVLSIDEERKSLTFAGDMPEGASARLMRSNSDELITSAGRAIAQATQELRGGDTPLVIAVSCVGRRLVLGERTEEEAESIVAGAPEGAGTIGFFAYGEIAPFQAGPSDLHNQTMTVTVFSEA